MTDCSEFVDGDNRFVDTETVGVRSDPNLAQVKALVEVAKWAEMLPAEVRRQPIAERRRIWQAAYRLETYVRSILPEPDSSVRLLSPSGAPGLTEEGLSLLEAAESLLEAGEGFSRAVERLGGQTPKLMVGCYPSHAPLLGHATQSLTASDPPIEVEIVASDDVARLDGGRNLLTSVKRHGLDLAIVPMDGADPELETDPLYSWRLAVVVSKTHPLFGMDSVEVKDLEAHHRLLASPLEHITRELLEDHGLTAPIWFSSVSVDALAGLAESGQGAAIIAGDAYPIRRTRLTLLKSYPTLTDNGSPLGGSFGVVYRKDKASPRVDELVAALRRAVDIEQGFASNRFVSTLGVTSAG